MNPTKNTPTPDDIESYLIRHRHRYRQELCDFLSIPSVSAQQEHRDDMVQAADWLAANLRGAGLIAEIHTGPGHPIVLAEWRGAGSEAPTVLIYGHYDVEPPGPVELWRTPPFEPTLREGRIYARGATDDKGQLLLHIKALEACLAVRGELPVNVILVAEGEEETGGSHLASFIEAHADRLRCSAIVVSDSAMLGPGMPALVTTLRGIVSLEIEVFGPARELHSGEYGGTVVNPAMALARILAGVHDADGRIVIPGFTDRCRDWPEAQRAELAELPFTDEAFREEAAVPVLGGEAGFTTLERRWMRPTFEIHGLVSGHTDEGTKSIIPPSALAKVSCRLVPDQNPEEIDRLVRAYVEERTPPGVRAEVRTLATAPPWRAHSADWLYAAATQATEATFGRLPLRVGGGGSIPVVTDFTRALGAPVLLLGFGLPGENPHAPNEHFELENFELGMRTTAVLLESLGRR